MDDPMTRVRAVRSILIDARNGKHPGQEQEELDAFMAIFHPDHQRIVLDSEETT